MGFLSSLFGSTSNNFDAIDFVQATTSFDARVGSRNAMMHEGKMFAYQNNPIDNPSPEYVKASAETLAGELIYLINTFESQGNKNGIASLKRAMKEYLVRYVNHCPNAYMAFMSTAYSSN